MELLSRRKLIESAGAIGGILALAPVTGVASTSTSLPNPSETKLKIVVAGGHPGDPEYGCGGTIARLTAAGHDVILLYLNEGEPKGSPEAGKGKRVEEAKHACQILKARPLYAGQIDGSAILDAAHYKQFHLILEKEQPNVVFTHWPIDNHADHRSITMLVYESWVKMARKFAIYYYEVSNGEDTVQFTPTHYVNISETTAQKHAACYAHASQAPEKFYALQQAVTRFRGIESGHKEAEAFIRHLQGPAFQLP